MRFDQLTSLTCSNIQLQFKYSILVCGSGYFDLRFWVLDTKSKTSKACAETLTKIIAINKKNRNTANIRACRQFYPEKIRANRGKEFSGEFAKLCREYFIEVHSTKKKRNKINGRREIHQNHEIHYLLISS